VAVLQYSPKLCCHHRRTTHPLKPPQLKNFAIRRSLSRFLSILTRKAFKSPSNCGCNRSRRCPRPATSRQRLSHLRRRHRAASSSMAWYPVPVLGFSGTKFLADIIRSSNCPVRPSRAPRRGPGTSSARRLRRRATLQCGTVMRRSLRRRRDCAKRCHVRRERYLRAC
jgi:hypothetical protein